ACRDVGAGLQPGTTVSVETTLPLGCTRSHIAPLLEQASGLMAERHFHIVFSPERVFSGRVFRDLDTYPKLVGGLSPECHAPGVAVGGHCIPVYPRFLLAGAPQARLPRVAREINEAMPSYAVDLLGEVAGRRVLVLGVTYRGGVKETAFSGALALRDELQA